LAGIGIADATYLGYSSEVSFFAAALGAIVRLSEEDLGSEILVD